MSIQSVCCNLSLCGDRQAEQTTCSLITRIATAALGSIALLVGVLALSKIQGFHALGTVGGSAIASIGFLTLVASFCLRSRKIDIKNTSPKSIRTTQSDQKKAIKAIPAESVATAKELMENFFELLMSTLEKSTFSLGRIYILTRDATLEDSPSTYQSLKEEYQTKIKQLIQRVDNVNYYEKSQEFYQAIDMPLSSLIHLSNACSLEQKKELELAQKKLGDFLFSLIL